MDKSNMTTGGYMKDSRIELEELNKEEYEERIQKLENEIFRLKNYAFCFFRDDNYYLQERSDWNFSELPTKDNNEIISLCSRDKSSEKSTRFLCREADLDTAGKFNIFHQEEFAAPNRTNKKMIAFDDPPSYENLPAGGLIYEVWTWPVSAEEESSKNPYITLFRNDVIETVEIINVKNVSNLYELCLLLKRGIKQNWKTPKILFSRYLDKGKFEGILCTTKELKIENGVTSLRRECNYLPVYKYDRDDVLVLDNEDQLYAKAFLGPPSEILYVNEPIQIVKDVILNSVSWEAYGNGREIRSEYEKFKEFIKEAPVENIIVSIQEALCCSTSLAVELIDKFFNEIDRYIDGTSFTDEVILKALLSNIELEERGRSLVELNWDIDVENRRVYQNDRLDEIKDELDSVNKDLKTKDTVIKQKEAEIARLNADIIEKEKMIAEYQEKNAHDNQSAQESLATEGEDLKTSSAKSVPKEIPESNNQLPLRETYSVNLASEKQATVLTYSSWKDVLVRLAGALQEAGVTGSLADGFAVLLCSAYLEKQPLLLVGPNTQEIIQAFTSTISNHEYGVISCEGEYSNQAINRIGKNGEKIVVINNLWTSGWVSRLPELLLNKEVFYIITHPYTEDILVEPKSLYNFMLPIFTEFVVNQKGNVNSIIGGQISDTYNYKIADKPLSRKKSKQVEVLSNLEISQFIQNNIRDLATTMYCMRPDDSIDREFFFTVFPISYALLSRDELAELITDPENDIRFSEQMKLNIKHILGEYYE
jgi:hypothetical protein